MTAPNRASRAIRRSLISTGDRDIDMQQEILAVLSDIADSLRMLRHLAAVAMWIEVALFVAFVGMAAASFISLAVF